MGSNPSRWFIALALVLGAGALPVAGSADTGPVPVNSPACLSVLPALTTSCSQPAASGPQAAGVSSAQGTQSSQARAFRVSAAPDLARTNSWRELGIGVVSAVAAPGTYGGRDVQIAAAEFGLRRP
jgi:hypothetical protein